MIGLYFLNKLPSILYQVGPAAVLISGITTLCMMSRHNEVMALKSGGVVLHPDQLHLPGGLFVHRGTRQGGDLPVPC